VIPKLISESTTEPITLAEAIQAANAYTDASDAQTGQLLSKLITAARQACERELETSLVQKTYEIVQDSFHPNVIELPYGPVRAVSSVTYVRDTDAVDIVIAADQYRLDAYSEPVTLRTAYDVDWPIDVRTDLNSVRVRYTVGYPSSDSPPETVPEPILQAMRLMIKHWYDNRSAVGDDSMREMPLAACYLLGKYRRGLGV
jgi:uncharacterized phiE125 gp8 family phage protein